MAPVQDRRRLLPPDHRAQEVRAWCASCPSEGADPRAVFSDPVQAEYALYLLNRYDEVSDAVYDACMLDGLPYARMVLKAFLFTSAPLHAVENATGVPEEAVLAYGKLFFDEAVFRNRLIKMSYLRAYSPTTKNEEELKTMFLWGLQLGWEYLEWKVTGGSTSLGTTDVMRKMMTDALWRSREHTFNSITDSRSKEARAWMPIALKLAENVNKADPDKVNSLDELRIRLEGLDVTMSKAKLTDVEILS